MDLAVIILMALLALSTCTFGTLYPPDNDNDYFSFQGRWLRSEDGVVLADWPCSRVQFHVTKQSANATSITLRLNLRRVRVHVVVVVGMDTIGTVAYDTVLTGKAIVDFAKDYEIRLPPTTETTTYRVSLTKMTQAAPYGNGIGKSLTSVLKFHGVEIDQGDDVELRTLVDLSIPSRRRISFVGASDTAGFCVDGTPETKFANLKPWNYGNCDGANPSVLGRRLQAEISVQAIAGIGVTQNAYADNQSLLGKATMPDYFNRTLQTTKGPVWNFTTWMPDLVVVSLGGNDFNNQKTTPSDTEFREGYEAFLLQIVNSYVQDGAPHLTIVGICGQGDPTELERNPNNDRCRPCPHVEDATKSFRTKYGKLVRVEYIFVPCDGTVVTGDGDIGCEGHKNQLGQVRVADFLEPRLRDIMAWPVTPGASSRNKIVAVDA